MTTKITKAHLAGLELALSRIESEAWAITTLNELIAQAKAAPDDEAAAWMLDGAVGGSCLEFQQGDLIDSQRRYGGCMVPLYTHPQPERGGVPAGFAIVPIEPTDLMREAFHEAHEQWDNGGYHSPDHQWEAMLAAAQEGESHE